MSSIKKFRAWDKDLEKYLGGCEIDSLMAELSAEDESRAVIIKQICPARYIFEQYTGLKDKNGKEIYEGDIVSCYSLSGEYGALFVVKYGKLPDICGHEYCPCLQGFYLDEIDEYEEVDEEGYIEVIGNIHEKSELLEDENGKN